MTNLRLLKIQTNALKKEIIPPSNGNYYKLTVGMSVYIKAQYLHQFGRFNVIDCHSWFDMLNDTVLDCRFIAEQPEMKFEAPCNEVRHMMLFFCDSFKRYIMVNKRDVLADYPEYFDHEGKIMAP